MGGTRLESKIFGIPAPGAPGGPHLALYIYFFIVSQKYIS